MARGLVVAISFLAWALAVGDLSAQTPQGRQLTPAEFERTLGYQSGTIVLRGGMATLRLPPSFRFVGPEGSRRLLTEAWGNPPEASEGVLGMLVPAHVSPLARDGWGIVITYEEDGYVKDDDAASINYAKLLKEMQDATVAENAERQKRGFEPVRLVGWAEPPSYDRAAHKLYWAKELAFGSESRHALNYDIRILGRRGVLVLNAVAEMQQLPLIRQQARAILAAVDFNGGHRYTDYVAGKDRTAAYGIAGLVAGATAAKAGFFKALWLGILAFKKLIFVGLIGLAAVIKQLLSRGKE